MPARFILIYEPVPCQCSSDNVELLYDGTQVNQFCNACRFLAPARPFLVEVPHPFWPTHERDSLDWRPIDAAADAVSDKIAAKFTPKPAEQPQPKPRFSGELALLSPNSKPNRSNEITRLSVLNGIIESVSTSYTENHYD